MNFRITFPRFRSLFVGLLLLGVLGSALGVQATSRSQGVRVVVIDAGHGGPKYPGATYGGYCEKNINLQVALKLGRLIEKELPGIKVVYTRTTDKQFSTDLNVDLQTRADIANRAEGDLFISIHANAARSTAARGVETLIMGESEKETRINEGVLYANNKEEFLDMSDERTAAIVRAYIQNLQFTYGQYSEAMARITQSAYAKAGFRDRGIKRQPLKVLYATDMPSILTEIGFMSNSVELKQMTSSKGQEQIARALLEAVKAYVEYVEKTLLKEEPAATASQGSASEATTPSSTETAAAAPEEPSAATSEKAGTTPAPSAPSAPSAPKKPAETPANKEAAAKSGYTIQVMASTKPVSVQSTASFKSYRGKVKEYTSSGTFRYKYCFGVYDSKAAASRDLAEVRRTFKDAFVVHFTGSEIK